MHPLNSSSERPKRHVDLLLLLRFRILRLELRNVVELAYCGGIVGSRHS